MQERRNRIFELNLALCKMIDEELIEEGVVVHSENGIAEIVLNESESCEECSAKIFCKPSENKTKKMHVFDPYGACPGEKVKISISGTSVLKASFFLYGIPLILLLSTIIVGMYLMESSSQPELFSFLLAVVVVCVYFMSFFFFGKRSTSETRLAKIISISRNNS